MKRHSLEKASTSVFLMIFAFIAALTAAACDFYNLPPAASAGSSRTVSLGSTVTLDGTGSSDPDNDSLTYEWSIMRLPDTSSLTNADIRERDSSTATVLPDVSGIYLFKLTVRDRRGEDSDLLKITVSETAKLNGVSPSPLLSLVLSAKGKITSGILSEGKVI